MIPARKKTQSCTLQFNTLNPASQPGTKTDGLWLRHQDFALKPLAMVLTRVSRRVIHGDPLKNRILPQLLHA
jgi:hypothetical protein